MIVLNQFPTHVAKTANKHKVNKMFKINNQAIYNGSLNRHQRAIVMRNMHNWLLEQFNTLKVAKNSLKSYPVQLVIRIHTVINHGNVSWSVKTGNVNWKYPSEEYIPGWDEDNLSAIWIKAIKDSLSEYKFWKDDSVHYCIGTDSKVVFVDNFDNRKIEIDFKKM